MMMTTMRRRIILIGGGLQQRHSYVTKKKSPPLPPGNTTVSSYHQQQKAALLLRCLSSHCVWSPTQPRCFPVKAIEVLSLGGGTTAGSSSSSSSDNDNNNINSNSSTTTGRLTKILHSVDSFVEAGDVVAEITTTTTATATTTSSCNSTTTLNGNDNVVVPVATPLTGKITQILYQMNDSISVGDVLFHIDTDQVKQQSQQQQSQQQSAAQELMTHLKENNGMITDAKMNEWMSSHHSKNNSSVQHLLALAKVLREWPPTQHHVLPSLAVRVKGLDLLQHALVVVVKQLQEPEKLTTTTATTAVHDVHMELGLFNAKLSYWDAAVVHFNHALSLLEQQQQQQQQQDVVVDVKNYERMAQCHSHLATIARQRNDITGCIQAFQEALQIQKAILATATAKSSNKKRHHHHHHHEEEEEKASAAVAAMYNNLGAIHYENSDYHQAIQYINLAIQERKKYMNDDNDNGDDDDDDDDAAKRRTRRRKFSEMAGSYTNLAMASKQTGDLNGALINCQTALQLHQRCYKDIDNEKMNHHHQSDDDDDDDDYDSGIAASASHETMGIILATMGHFEAALEQYRAACKIHEEIINMTNDNNNSNNNNSPQDASALSLLSSSLTVASMYNKIGAVCYQMKDFNQALKEHHKALDILNQADAAMAPANAVPPSLIRDLANTYNHIGLVLLKRRGGSSNSNNKKQGTKNDDNNADLDKALESHQTARKMLEHVLGMNNPQLAMTVGSIGNVLQEQGKLDQALSAFREAHAFLVMMERSEQQRSKPIKLSPDIAASHNNIGLVLARLGNFDEALIEYRAARQVFADTLGSTHPHTASCHFNIGLTLISQQESSAGATGQTSDTTTSTTNQLSVAAASEEFDMARVIWASALGHDHPQTLMAAEYVEKLTDATR